MKRRFLILLAALMMTATTVVAAERSLSKVESDSVAAALATIYGDYLKNKAARDGVAISGEYMRGVQDALKMAMADDAYFLGIEQGVNMAQHIRQVEQLGGFKVDVNRFAMIIQRLEKGRPAPFTPQTANAYLDWLMTKIAKENHVIDGSKPYLEEVAKREGVIKTPSGLLFEVITEGEGDQPGPEDLVLVKYSGRLIDDTVFNESENANGTVFSVKETIPGFKEGLQMMKKGGIYRLYIPAEIGYGEEGVSGLIPGGAATIFDVELIDLRHASELQQEQMQQYHHVPAENTNE